MSSIHKSVPRLVLVEASRPRKSRAHPSPHALARRFEAPRLVTEARQESRTVQMHASLLVGVGVEPAVLDEVDVRIALLSSAHRPPASSRRGAVLGQVSREAEFEMASALRDALRDDPAARIALDRLSDGAGVDDMMEDFAALAQLVVLHAERLRAAGNDPTKLAFRALEIEVCMSVLVGQRRVRLSFAATVNKRRHRAAHPLIEALEKLEEASLAASSHSSAA